MSADLDLAQATAAIADPTTSGATLQAIASAYPSLWRGIARHPQAYPALLDWLYQAGDDGVKAAVKARRVVPAPQPAVAPQAAWASAPLAALPQTRTANRRLPLLIALIGLVVVAVVVAVIVMVPKLRGNAPGGSGGLQVTGTAPDSTPRQPTFLDGMQKVTQFNGYGWVIGATDKLAILSASTPTGQMQTISVDKSTGNTVWTFDGKCSNIIEERSLGCATYASGYGSFFSSLEWVDAQTGQIQGSLDTSSLGDVLFDFIDTSQGVLVIGAPNETYLNDSRGDSAIRSTMAFFTGPGGPKWTTPVGWPDYNGGLGPQVIFDEGSGLFAWHSGSQGIYVVDERTGYVAYQGNRSYGGAQVFANRIAFVGPDSAVSSLNFQQVTVPGSGPVILTTVGEGDTQMLMLGPGHPDILLSTSSYGTEAHDPANQDMSQRLWQSPGQSSPDAWPMIQAIAWDGQTTAYAASEDGRVWAFDVDTGHVLWWSSYLLGPITVWQLDISTSGALVNVSAAADGADAFATNTILRADTGQQIPSLSTDSGYGFLQDGILLQYTYDNLTGSQASTVYVPSFSDQARQLLQAPSGMPSCPSGLSVVSWTKFDTGSILVCGGERYEVVIDDSVHPKVTASRLDFGAGGFSITCKDGTVYRIGGGASIVVVDAKGDSGVHPASESWMPSTGQVAYPSAGGGIQSCPAGTWPISLSTWQGGWLLVCGTDLATPTWLGYSDGTNTGTTSDVAATSTSYCGTIDAGQVCAYTAPALVVLTPQSGDPLQHPVDANYFPSAGQGGAGQGTGSYGVPAPDQTAADQARYLEQVLQASEQTRADLRAILDDLNQKIATDYDIATLQSVVTARQQQIAAVDGAPVTALPNGDALVAQLREALSVSQQTDQLYVQWAQQIQAQDWAGADATVAQWRGPAAQSETLKQGFCDQWNTQIAPAYNVSTFTASQI